MSYLGVDFKGLIHRYMSHRVKKGTIHARTPGSRDPNDPTAGIKGGSPSQHAFRGFIGFYRDNEVDNELVLHEDRKIVVITNSINPFIVPELGMSIEMDDKQWEVVRVNRDESGSAFICQGRL